MERNSGYFLVWRKIWKSPVFKNLKQCAIWIYMISQATHTDKTLKFLDNKVFDLLLNNPLANHQIADTMEIPLSSVCARIRELQVDGKVEDSGKRAMSKYKRECVVWQRSDQIK